MGMEAEHEEMREREEWINFQSVLMTFRNSRDDDFDFFSISNSFVIELLLMCVFLFPFVSLLQCPTILTALTSRKINFWIVV